MKWQAANRYTLLHLDSGKTWNPVYTLDTPTESDKMENLEFIKAGIQSLIGKCQWEAHDELAILLDNLRDGFEGTADELAQKFDAYVDDCSAVAQKAYRDFYR